MSQQRYRVGIAGVTHGHVSAHLREWKTLPNVEVVAIADANREERGAYVRRFELEGVREYDSPAAMLEAEQVHVASVCNETRPTRRWLSRRRRMGCTASWRSRWRSPSRTRSGCSRRRGSTACRC